MALLRIEHAVQDFAVWKRAFDSDPVGRRNGGVRRYEVQRAASDPNFVAIDLHFDDTTQAELFLGKLRALWAGPAKAVAKDPAARIFEKVESGES
jgi:hypothetical protein